MCCGKEYNHTALMGLLGAILGHFESFLSDAEQDTGASLEPISHLFCFTKGPEWPQFM